MVADLLCRNILEEAELAVAGIVDQYVDTSKALKGSLDRGDRLGHIEADRQ